MAKEWIVTKVDDFGEPLLRELVEVVEPKLTYEELLALFGDAPL